jgi:hypothetical protein
MRSYLVKIALILAVLLSAHVFVLLTVPALIPAEYWIRETIIVKKAIAKSLPSPRIVFLAGSSALFGIDAKAIEASTGISTMNMGLHGGLRLEQILNVGEDMARPGDVIVLALERDYYSCKRQRVTSWQMRNWLAWDRDYFDVLPLRERVWGALSASDPSLMLEIVGNAVGSRVVPGLYARRRAALAPASTIVKRFLSGVNRPTGFAYSAYNLDDRGDMLHISGSYAVDPGVSGLEPAHVCPPTLAALAQFVAKMRARKVRVIFSHEPYLIEHRPENGWRQSEAAFARDIHMIGSELLEGREKVFFPRQSFFNLNEHLNEAARRKRSAAVAADLKRLGIFKK